MENILRDFEPSIVGPISIRIGLAEIINLENSQHNKVFKKLMYKLRTAETIDLASVVKVVENTKFLSSLLVEYPFGGSALNKKEFSERYRKHRVKIYEGYQRLFLAFFQSLSKKILFDSNLLKDNPEEICLVWKSYLDMELLAPKPRRGIINLIMGGYWTQSMKFPALAPHVTTGVLLSEKYKSIALHLPDSHTDRVSILTFIKSFAE